MYDKTLQESLSTINRNNFVYTVSEIPLTAQTMKSFQDIFYLVGVNNISYFGHNLSNLIAKYESLYVYQSSPLLRRFSPQIINIPHPSYFNCYRFSMDFTHFQPDFAFMSFMLYADSLDRHNVKFSDFGFFISVDMNGSVYYGNNIEVLPGQNIQMDLSMSYYKQLPKPYGSCLETPAFNSIWTLDGHNLKYSTQSCAYALIQREVMDKVGCELLTNFVLPRKNVSFSLSIDCEYWIGKNISNDEFMTVLEEALTISKETCLDLCEGVYYNRHIVSLPWLHMSEVPLFYEEYIKNMDYEYRFQNMTENKNFSDLDSNQLFEMHRVIKDNFAMVTIELNLKDILVYKEVPQFSLTSFIGALGGILNLYSGISFIVIIELADFVINVCKRNCYAQVDNGRF